MRFTVSLCAARRRRASIPHPISLLSLAPFPATPLKSADRNRTLRNHRPAAANQTQQQQQEKQFEKQQQQQQQGQQKQRSRLSFGFFFLSLSLSHSLSLPPSLGVCCVSARTLEERLRGPYPLPFDSNKLDANCGGNPFQQLGLYKTRGE